jgi:phospholipid/cholesterol/gamma-HCH transport system permease protein
VNTGVTGLSSRRIGNIMVSVRYGDGGEAVLTLSDHVSLSELNQVTREARQLFADSRVRMLIVDLQSLAYVDSAGALFLRRLEQEARERSIPLEVRHMSSRGRGVVDLVDPRALVSPAPLQQRSLPRFFEDIGFTSVRFLDDILQSITFGGLLISEVSHSILHPSSVRWQDVLSYMKKVGVDGLPILGLVSFLLGLIMAFMSSLQLKQFGANMYVASLVAIAMVRELGPMITAILVAGRSGSAFAAEIGTMRTNEEVDALITMGFNPVRFLAVPKVFAAMLAVPLLTFFADLFAIVGGMVVGILGLDLTFHTYSVHTAWALTVFDIGAGVVKSVVFAVLIAGIGCHRGFQVRGGAESVGNAATSAVVSGLFLVIVTDSVFAIILNYIRW